MLYTVGIIFMIYQGQRLCPYLLGLKMLLPVTTIRATRTSLATRLIGRIAHFDETECHTLLRH
jgi:hypothetical protein